MTPQDYDYLRGMLKERSGLVLSADKQYLVESRLLPLARKGGMASLAELVTKLKLTPGASLANDVTEAMTTNESFFFRDKIPFEHLRDTILPALIKTHYRRKRIRIWCTAAASGQEPYSIAMILRDMAASLEGFRVDILATDISSEILEKARAGLYTQFEVQRGLPIQLLVKHFAQIGDVWQISPELRSMIAFRRLNLLHDFTHLGFFDVVFCRNVLIYFDQPTKANVLTRLARVTEPDGYLLLGAAETVIGLTDAFKPMADKRGLYVPTTPAPATDTTQAGARIVKFAAKA